MKKVIRLTESDLIQLIKRVISEQSNIQEGKPYSNTAQIKIGIPPNVKLNGMTSGTWTKQMVKQSKPGQKPFSVYNITLFSTDKKPISSFDVNYAKGLPQDKTTGSWSLQQNQLIIVYKK